MSVIFLAGVHGVGKGYLGVRVAKALGIPHYTASQLIREQKSEATWGADKKVSGIDDNQVALICGLAKKRMNDKDCLLDGHFVLRNSDGVLVPLDESVFKSLELSGVILLTEDAPVIAARLACRDGIATDLKEITELASSESAHAYAVCRAIGVPLVEIHAPTEQAVLDAFAQLKKA